MAEQLSPAAQSVLDAYRSSHLSINNLAAAIEALADQVVPEEPDGGMAARWTRQSVRRQILAIVADLRGKVQSSSEEH